MSMSLLVDAQDWLSPLPDSFHQLQARWWLPVAIWSWSWPAQPSAIHCQVWNKRWNCWRSRGVRGKGWGALEERAQNSPRSRSRGSPGQFSWSMFQPEGRAQDAWREEPACPYHFQPLQGLCGEGGVNPPQNSAKEAPFSLWINISFLLRGSVWILQKFDFMFCLALGKHYLNQAENCWIVVQDLVLSSAAWGKSSSQACLCWFIWNCSSKLLKDSVNAGTTEAK